MARKKRPETSEARRFAVILGLLLGLLGGGSWWRGHLLRAELLWGAGVAVVACAFALIPVWLRLFRLWMKLADGLSWVTTRLILALFFYVVMTPYGLLSRWLREDPLDLAWKDGRPSYWIDVPEGERTPERYENMF